MSASLKAPTHCGVVVGVGASKGIGAAVCRRIAREGLLVHVVGRTPQKINLVVAEIQQAGGQAVAHTVDAINPEQIKNLFAQIAAEGHIIDLAVNNVGSNMPSSFLRTSAKFFDDMWRMTFLSAFLVSQSAIPAMLPQKKGTLIFTGASGSLRGKPFFAAFTTGKSGLRAYVQAIAAEFKPSGIHVAHVIIDGMVDGDRINHFAFGLGRLVKLSLKGLNGGLDVEAIAESYWQIHQQPRDIWVQEIDLRPFKEKF